MEASAVPARRSVGLLRVAATCVLLSVAGCHRYSADIPEVSILDRTEPAAGVTIEKAPTRIQLWFFEAVAADKCKMDVTGPSGRLLLGPIENAGYMSFLADIRGRMPNGEYKIDWLVGDEDGHVQSGKYSFFVKRSIPTQPVQ